MKTIELPHDLTPALAKARHWLGEIPAAIKLAACKIGRVLAGAHQSFQRARLASVLAHLSDEQLAQIGIKRSEIWAHVEKITAYEYDGL